MRALRLVETRKPLVMQEIPVPAVGPGDVLVSVKAAGICHSDAHYRAGRSPVYPLPMTLGHEVAGVVAQVGEQVIGVKEGDRVCIHYMVTCGQCVYCNQGNEQFCTSGAMIGKYRDGGYAEYICVPARSVFQLPAGISFEQGAVLMCSSATSFHALKKARLRAGETVAVYGVGGLGVSAVQLARAFGALEVFAVDIKPVKLELARKFGAVPIHAAKSDPVAEVERLTDGRGVDVALELVGSSLTMEQAFKSLALKGRLAIAGLTEQPFTIYPYRDLINKEAEIIGVSDHLAQEIPQLLEWVRQGKLDLSGVITRRVPLDEGAVNQVLDNLEMFSEDVRVVIMP